MKKFTILSLTLCLLAFTYSDTNIWVQKAYYGGGPRSNATSFTIGNYAYVGTGTMNNPAWTKLLESSFTKTLYRYDPTQDVWRRMADLPSSAVARMNAIGFSINGKGYVCGGIKFVLLYEPIYNVGDIWEYNPETNLWYQRTSFPRAGGISNGIGFSIGSKGYVGLGMATGLAGGNQYGPQNDFYEYDPIQNKWTRLNDFPGAPRYCDVGFSMNGKGYVGLGYSFEGNSIIYYKDFWEYDQATDEWTRLPDFPGEGRYQHVLGYGVDGSCYIGLGDINDFYKYDVAKREWTNLSYLPGSERTGSFSFGIGSNIYYGGGVIGGSQGTVVSDMWEYKTVETTGLKESKIPDFKCYPNPTHEKITIEMPENHTISAIKLIDVSGKVIYENNGNKKAILELNLSNYKKGNYVLQIEGKNGTIVTKKIIKN